MVQQTRENASWIWGDMPDNTPVSDAQFRLADAHGTPKEFARGLVECIGEISILEAQQAAEKYKREWNAA